MGRSMHENGKFLQRLAVNLNTRARVASQVIEGMLVKNDL
jgi:hypothetical protein